MNLPEIIRLFINICYNLILSLIKMKVFSACLLVGLFFVVAGSLHSAISLYMGYAGLHVFGISIEQVNEWEMPYIILFICYFASLAAAFLMYRKKRYIVSCIIAGVMILSYIILPLFGFQWLK